MNELLISAVTALIVLFFEAWVKPELTNLYQKRIRDLLPELFDAIDPVISELISQGSVALKEHILAQIVTKNLGSKAPSFKDGFVLNF